MAAEPAAAPHPMGDRAIDQDQPRAHEQHESGELHAVGERAGDQCRGDDGEGHLEAHIDRFRDRPRQRADRVDGHRLQEEIFEAADPPIERLAVIGREGDRVADDHPQHGDDAGRPKGLSDGSEHVLLAHHAAIEEGKARDRHHQHERGGCQHPRRVAGIDRRYRRCCGGGGRSRLGGGVLSQRRIDMGEEQRNERRDHAEKQSR